jgi:hypothetical protein
MFGISHYQGIAFCSIIFMLRLRLLVACLWTSFVITKHAKVYIATLLILLQ